MELGAIAFKYWIEALFGLIIIILTGGYKLLGKRFKQMQAEQDAVRLGIQAMLRDRIISIYNHYIDGGYCPIYALENVEALYKEYQALGGNGAVTKLVEDLRRLPTPKNGG